VSGVDPVQAWREIDWTEPIGGPTEWETDALIERARVAGEELAAALEAERERVRRAEERADAARERSRRHYAQVWWSERRKANRLEDEVRQRDERISALEASLEVESGARADRMAVMDAQAERIAALEAKIAQGERIGPHPRPGAPMTAPRQTTAELVERARWRSKRGVMYVGDADIITALADRLAALAPLEPLGRLVEAMEAQKAMSLTFAYEADPMDYRKRWVMAVYRYGFKVDAEGDTFPEALAALADALEREAREAG
jgi:hypothetical protein